MLLFLVARPDAELTRVEGTIRWCSIAQCWIYSITRTSQEVSCFYLHNIHCRCYIFLHFIIFYIWFDQSIFYSLIYFARSRLLQDHLLTVLDNDALITLANLLTSEVIHLCVSLHGLSLYICNASSIASDVAEAKESSSSSLSYL